MLDPDKIYKDLHGNLHSLDQQRLAHYRKVEPFKWGFWSIFLAGGSFLIGYANLNGDERTVIYAITYGVLVFLSVILYAVMHNNQLKKFKVKFLSTIAPKIINNLGNSFRYNYDGAIPTDVIKASRIFPNFDKYSCQDLVNGDLNGTPITFAEVDLVKRQHSNNQTTHTTVFSGIFFQAELPISFPTGIWIVPWHQWKSFFGDDRKRLKLDHPALKRYRVYTDDLAIAEKILQSFILDRIADVNKKLKERKIAKLPLNYHFEGNTIQMAISTKYRFMEPKLGESIDDVEFIRKQTDLLNALGSLLQDLTLVK
ncbi:MAG: DUF3137 domain-containing protein [Bacteroidota bacterium]